MDGRRINALSRRGFGSLLIGLVAAPAIVRVSSLMPVKLFVPPKKGKWLMPEPWIEFPLNQRPGLTYVPPEGFKPWETRDVLEIKVDFRENKVWCRRKPQEWNLS